MLPAFILGLILLVVVILVSRWATQVDPRALLRLLGWTGGAVAVVAFLLLAVSGRLAWALAVLAALLPWLGRLLWGLALGNVLKRALGALGTLGSGSGPAAGGFGSVGGGAGWRAAGWGRADDRAGRSEVTTRFLRMSLDHTTGRMDGVVLEGPSAGRALAALDRRALAALWRATGADTDSRRVLEAWLDRAHADWRETLATDDDPGPGGAETAGAGQESGAESDATSGATFGGGPLSRTEALAILGLNAGADAEAIQAAWRRLMRGVHPDHGGSPYLAARLNQARDVLLKRKKAGG